VARRYPARLRTGEFMVVEQINATSVSDPENDRGGEQYPIPVLIGIASGISGLVAFLVLHQILVSPI
jgi:hypothetical protein